MHAEHVLLLRHYRNHCVVGHHRIGLARGLIREVLALGVWIAALLAAWFFYRPVAMRLEPWLETPSLQMGAAVVTIVLAVLIAGAILGWILSTLVEKTDLTGTDRLLGMVFGAGRGVVVVALLVFLASLAEHSNHPRANRIQHHVPGQFQQVTLTLHQNGLEAP